MANSSSTSCPCPASAGSGSRSSTIAPSLSSSAARASVPSPDLRGHRRRVARRVGHAQPGQLHRPGLAPGYRRDLGVAAVRQAISCSASRRSAIERAIGPAVVSTRNLRIGSMNNVPVNGTRCSVEAHPEHPAERGRALDRPAGIGRDVQRGQARGHRYGRAGRGAPGRPGRIPRVPGQAEHAVLPPQARPVRLPHHDRPGRFQPGCRRSRPRPGHDWRRAGSRRRSSASPPWRGCPRW